MADDNTIIEGTVKFRDGKKWKSRWCVMRKLSPVADCVHLQLYRDARARWGSDRMGRSRAGARTGGECKASLSLQQYLGCEAGFTLDKHSNTLALVCRDLVAVLAFETRERLIQWQVKVSAHLGEGRHYLVLVGAGVRGVRRGRLPAGPARLHVRDARAALTAGLPPRLLAVWELHHLRRYGVVEGRFCFEGGSRCGRGEGLHVLVTDEAQEIARAFKHAARRHLRARGDGSPTSHAAFRPDTRLSELSAAPERPADLRLVGEASPDAAESPYCWPSAERAGNQTGDAASLSGAEWGSGAGRVTLERCMSCMSKLGAMSRSSTAALTPGAKHFSPAWTMDAVQETPPEQYGAPNDQEPCKSIEKTEEISCCYDHPPARPPKPSRLDLEPPGRTPPGPPAQSDKDESKSASIGPYENYDVPKVSSVELEGEYYDTPRRLNECLSSELFKITKNSVSNTLILKKPCGCLLKLGSGRKEPTVIETEESVQPSECPCRRVTDWANHWMKLPYCRRKSADAGVGGESAGSAPHSQEGGGALYATVDVARKARRRARRQHATDEGPLAHYENLSFALSLEHYENAKALLRRAGVTQAELDAIGDNLRPAASPRRCHRAECGAGRPSGRHEDDYLAMEPNAIEGDAFHRSRALPAGYTPMSPIGGFPFHTLKHSALSPIGRLLDEKSASNPTLCDEVRGDVAAGVAQAGPAGRTRRPGCRKRSSSADSSRFLEDEEELEAGSRGSSLETLRNLAVGEDEPPGGAPRAPSPAARGESWGAGGARRAGSAPSKAGANRDSSSSNDSGVSSCSLRPGAEFELPPTTAAARRHYRSARRAAASPPAVAPPRRARSTEPPAPCDHRPPSAKSCSAEAEVPLLCVRSLRGVADAHSTSSGASDMSDYIETMSLCSSHSSTDTPVTMRTARQTTSTLRPRSGKEYHNLDPRLTSPYRHYPHPPHSQQPPHQPYTAHLQLYNNLS